MKRLLPLLAVLILAASCEKEVSLNIPEQEARLTLYCVGRAGDTLTAQVGRSRSIMARRVDSLLYTKDAGVVLWEDGGAPDTLRYDAERGRYGSHTVIRAGHRYRLQAMLPGYAAAEATAEAPATVAVQRAERARNARTTPAGVGEDELRLRFADPAAGEDFYRVEVVLTIQDPEDPSAPPFHEAMYTCVHTADPDVQSFYGAEPGSLSLSSDCAELASLFLTDRGFNGSTKDVKILVPSHLFDAFKDPATGMTPPGLMVSARLVRSSAAYIRYRTSLAAFYSADDNPFAEPVNVWGNVQGGYGIFALESSDEAPLP